jgi:hypothetical protein
MCVMSAVMDQYSPYIPQPNSWPYMSTAPGYPAASPAASPVLPVPDQIDAMKTFLESFHKATEAAQVFDEQTGQPDCIDPEKAQLLDRVAQLEAKIKKLEHPELVTFTFEATVDIDIEDFMADRVLNSREDAIQEIIDEADVWDYDFDNIKVAVAVVED